MKKCINLFILTLISWSYSYSQDTTSSCHYELDLTTMTKLYLYADTEPSFPGGQEKMINFIAKNLKYPSCGDYNGAVYLSFIVNADGSLSNIHIKRGLSYEVDQASIDVIKKMPNWIPAKCQNENVAHVVLLPIHFGNF